MPPRASASQPKDASPQRLIQGAIQSGQFPPVYYLHGDDDYLKDAAVRDLLAAALDPAVRDFNCEIRRGQELDAETVGSLLGTPPMLAERRAVVIRDVTALKKAPREVLLRHLARPAPDTLLLLTSPTGTKPDAAIAAASVSIDFAPLTPERLRRWIVYHADTVLGATVTDEAVALLQQGVGNDLHLLAGELDKCLSHVRGRGAAEATDTSTSVDTPRPVLDADAVTAVVGIKRGETATDLLDAVGRRDAVRAVSLVEHVLSQPKANAVQLLMQLATQAFALAYGRARRDAGIPMHRLPQEYMGFLKETGGFPGRPWGEAVNAWMKVTDQWRAADCERALALLLDAELALKESTVSSTDQILQGLVLALCSEPARRAA